eukprot:Awhi_evm2s3929
MNKFASVALLSIAATANGASLFDLFMQDTVEINECNACQAVAQDAVDKYNGPNLLKEIRATCYLIPPGFECHQQCVDAITAIEAEGKTWQEQATTLAADMCMKGGKCSSMEIQPAVDKCQACKKIVKDAKLEGADAFCNALPFKILQDSCHAKFENGHYVEDYACSQAMFKLC